MFEVLSLSQARSHRSRLNFFLVAKPISTLRLVFFFTSVNANSEIKAARQLSEKPASMF